MLGQQIRKAILEKSHHGPSASTGCGGRNTMGGDKLPKNVAKLVSDT